MFPITSAGAIRYHGDVGIRTLNTIRRAALPEQADANLVAPGAPNPAPASKPLLRTTPYPSWPVFGEDEVAAATAVLRSGKVNYWSGEEGRSFEREFAAAVHCRHAVALSSGTIALELALRALSIGPGDEVITAARTFIASASCIVAVGATPVMADVDRDSQNVTAETLLPALTSATRAVLVVHLAGWPCDMDAILAFAAKHNLKVIEDCAQAHGSAYKGRPVGSMGHIGAFSFCQDKAMTTAGEGGMLTTNDPSLFEAAWAYKDHGKSYDAVFHRTYSPGFRWLHESWGTNGRLSEVQAAVGRVQLGKLPAWVSARRRNASILHESFSHIRALRLTPPWPDVFHTYYRYYAFIRPEALRPGWTRDRIMQQVSTLGAPCFSGSCGEIYLEKAFLPALRPANRLPVARELGETSLAFLVHPTLNPSDMQDMCRVVEQVFAQATI